MSKKGVFRKANKNYPHTCTSRSRCMASFFLYPVFGLTTSYGTSEPHTYLTQSSTYKPYVNTKNWYREETDLWAEFGRRAPFGRRFSSKRSVEASAVGSTSLFGRRTVLRLKKESIRECVMTWIEYKEGMN
jgi:hypothetical protein